MVILFFVDGSLIVSRLGWNVGGMAHSKLAVRASVMEILRSRDGQFCHRCCSIIKKIWSTPVHVLIVYWFIVNAEASNTRDDHILLTCSYRSCRSC